jgi:hypothetical protein
LSEKHTSAAEAAIGLSLVGTSELVPFPIKKSKAVSWKCRAGCCKLDHRVLQSSHGFPRIIQKQNKKEKSVTIRVNPWLAFA